MILHASTSALSASPRATGFNYCRYAPLKELGRSLDVREGDLEQLVVGLVNIGTGIVSGRVIRCVSVAGIAIIRIHGFDHAGTVSPCQRHQLSIPCPGHIPRHRPQREVKLSLDRMLRMQHIAFLKTAAAHSRIEPEIKKRADGILQRLGLSPTEAIRMFYTQIALRNGLPFDVAIPNDETIKALEDSRNGLRRFRTASTLPNAPR